MVIASAPNWAEILQGAGSIVGVASLLLAAAYGLYQLREARKDRHVEVIADIGRRWDSDDLIKARKDAARFSDVQLAEIA
jgi:hypothetical protein